LAVQGNGAILRFIHDITNDQFRSKLEPDLPKLKGNIGIGVISDYEDQPLIIGSHLGTYAIVTVGVIKNEEQLVRKAFSNGNHFSEMSASGYNPTELVASCINQQSTFEEGIEYAQSLIEGSCSLLLLTNKGIYAARDRLGRTPIVIGEKQDSYAVTLETSAFPNLDYTVKKFLGPGEIVLLTPDGVEQKRVAGDKLQICSFLWVYYGYPSSHYEGINVEYVRNRCGEYLACNDDVQIDLVAGIPDSGTAHAIGYANKACIPYRRPFVKYTPTWPRSFMPQVQDVRDLVARMKLVPIPELIKGQRLLFCEDSIVRGTQLKDTIQRLYEFGAREVHMRPACPPLIYGCKYLNFSRSRSELDLAGRRAISELEKNAETPHPDYANPDSEKFQEMVLRIGNRLGLTTLKYQKLENLVKAIGLPKQDLCTYCWDGCEG
jgi:amidophosphoribosyltransferase